MAAYYNENDPYAAQWLRNLISAGHIAPGDVDERDIRDVRPFDLDGYEQCHFFAGIGAWSYALRLAGWPDDKPVWTGSCPCQPFSSAGEGKGFADERHLWPDFHWLIDQRRPPIVFGEQVASKGGLSWIDLVHADMEASRYAVWAADLCAAGIGAPHIRQRLWWAANNLEDTIQFGRNAGHSPMSQSEGRHIQPEQRSQHGVVAVAEGVGGGTGLCDCPTGSRGSIAPDDCATDILGYASRTGLSICERQEFRGSGWRQEGGATEQSGGSSGWVGNADGGKQRKTRDIQSSREHRLQQECGGSTGEKHQGPQPSSNRLRTGPVNSLWRDADWLFCRDGKWRPVEPGTFPLAHGAPARVGRLRAYGNAINPHAAAEFISVWAEVTGEH